MEEKGRSVLTVPVGALRCLLKANVTARQGGQQAPGLAHGPLKHPLIPGHSPTPQVGDLTTV